MLTERHSFLTISLCLCYICLIITMAPGETTAWRINASSAGEGNKWTVKPSAEAITGETLSIAGGHNIKESIAIPVTFPIAGRYVLSVRYQSVVGQHCDFAMILRDEQEQGLFCGRIETNPHLNTHAPYIQATNDAEGFVWKHFTVDLNRSVTGQISFIPLMHRGPFGVRNIDCVVINANSAYDVSDINAVAKLPTACSIPMATPIPPDGLKSASGIILNAAMFEGIEDVEKQFSASMAECGMIYRDNARLTKLGFNRQATFGSDDPHDPHGLYSMFVTPFYWLPPHGTAKKFPYPEGRFVDAAGNASQSIWSLFFDPLEPIWEKSVDEHIERAKKVKDSEKIISIRVSAEEGGFLDYSDYAKTAFINWLKEKYGSITKLNQRWGKSIMDFNSIELPKSAQDNTPGWLEFRDFCGQSYAKIIRKNVDKVQQANLENVYCITQGSNLQLLPPKFLQRRPKNWETFVDIALENVDYVGWDGYCADDYMGCEVDLMDSLAGDRKLINQEMNVHSTDWRIMARTYWTQVAKGVRGIYNFQFQQGTGDDSYPKWSFLNRDFTPKDKLGAVSDCIFEVRRLENILTDTKAVDVVKPVAIFYNQIDLALDGQPLFGAWGEGTNSPYRLYEILRGMGWPVTWITDKQICNGGLDRVGAVVLASAEHISLDASKKIVAWVQAGGSVIGDGWPGAFDELGLPNGILQPLFGVRATEVVKPSGTLEESPQGYGEVTINAMTPDQRSDSVAEMWQQWDSTHPVAQTMGNYMMSGFGRKNVQCVDGEVVGMTFGGKPGVVVNDIGKGHTLYVAMLLGSLYDGSCTDYERDTAHSGHSPQRLLDTFLHYAGLTPMSSVSLPITVASKIRVERPLQDSYGNVVVGIESFNDLPLKKFDIILAWPNKFVPNPMTFWVSNGSRELTLISAHVNGNKMTVTIPHLNTHGTLLMLNDTSPLVGLSIHGADRGIADMLEIHPAQTFHVLATIYNPSKRTLGRGELTIALPLGWAMSAESLIVEPILPGQSGSVTFTIGTPTGSAPRSLEPLLVNYSTSKAKAMPTTEVMWLMP